MILCLLATYDEVADWANGADKENDQYPHSLVSLHLARVTANDIHEREDDQK
jgi:hypothetical protein